MRHGNIKTKITGCEAIILCYLDVESRSALRDKKKCMSLFEVANMNVQSSKFGERSKLFVNRNSSLNGTTFAHSFEK